MAFQTLLFDVSVEEVAPVVSTEKSRKQAKKKAELRGCENCTLNEVEGVQKIMGQIKGRGILILAQSPGPEENEQGRELVGPSGQWLWEELEQVGIKRKDCDLQNAIRCFPADAQSGSYRSYLKMRNPTAHEIKCCSIHTERALQELKARQILIFGKVAAKAFLGRTLPSAKIFWHEPSQARVYILDHPSFFIRGYGAGPRYDAFKATLQAVARDRAELTGGSVEFSDQYSYLRKQDYRLVLTQEDAEQAEAIIRKTASKGRRISVDIESDPKGKIVCIGFSDRKGRSFVFVIRHPEQVLPNGYRVRDVAERILGDESIEKALQFGCSDESGLFDDGIYLRGYTHDTYFSEYLRFSDVKAYGLDETAERRFTEFSGYKTILAEEMLKGIEVPPGIANGTSDVKYKYIEKEKLFDITKVALETLRLYNGADCDITKRIELSNKGHVPKALMRLYVDLGRLLYRMEPNGPLFDYEQHEALAYLYPHKEQLLRAELRELIGDPEFNPGSHPQVMTALYETLGLEFPFEGKPNTQKMALLMLGREHEFPNKELEWRSVDKMRSTLEGYVRSAQANEGKLRTKWNGTGTRTGRLSSSGDKKSKTSTKVNLQNIKKDPQIQNMCVADLRWREVYSGIGKLIQQYAPAVLKYWRACDRELALAKKKARKPSLPPMDACESRQFRKVSRRIEKWVRRYYPDLKTYLIDDYGQVEVRLLAQMSGDENLIADCQSGDIHTLVGVAMTGWDADRIRHDEQTRTLTKNCIAEGQLVLTDQGLVPIECVTTAMRVWDGVEWVRHDGVEYMGEREVISFDGLVATPDHEVWDVFDRKIKFSQAQSDGFGLAVTGNQEAPVRYTYDNLRRDTQYRRLPHNRSYVQRLSPAKSHSSGQYTSASYEELCLPTAEEIPRSSRTGFAGSVLCTTTALREPQKSELGELRWSRDREQISISRSFCNLRTSDATPSDVQECRSRQERQQRALRARELTPSYETGKRPQQADECNCAVQGHTHDSYRGRYQNERRLSTNDASCTKSTALPMFGDAVESTNQSQGERPLQKAKVYDILNAGPRHRFTVEGRLVSNCHFGIIFGLSKNGLYKFVVAMSPVDMRGRITEEQVNDAYDRYFARYSKVKLFIERQRAFAFEHHYVETIFGMIQTLNVTDDSVEDIEDIIGGDEGGEEKRGGYWGNMAINGPVQGSAHQLMICALVNLIRNKKRFEILGLPVLEVHDALYFAVDVLTLGKAIETSAYLLEQASLETVKSDFPHIKWCVPIVVEAKAGIRLGTKVDVSPDITPGDFLLKWWRKCRDQVRSLNKELETVASAVNAA